MCERGAQELKRQELHGDCPLPWKEVQHFCSQAKPGMNPHSFSH